MQSSTEASEAIIIALCCWFLVTVVCLTVLALVAEYQGSWYQGFEGGAVAEGLSGSWGFSLWVVHGICDFNMAGPTCG